MPIRLVIVIAVAFPMWSHAADDTASCPDFGLDSRALQQTFCEQLSAILRLTGRDRSGGTEDETIPIDELEQAPWRDLDMLNRAYERDPRKTLALIDRIRNAGGLED